MYSRFYESTAAWGAEVVTDTELHEVESTAIQFLGTTVVTSLTTIATNGYTGNTINGTSFGDQTVIYGNFTSLKLASGKAIMYKVKPHK